MPGIKRKYLVLGDTYTDSSIASNYTKQISLEYGKMYDVLVYAKRTADKAFAFRHVKVLIWEDTSGNEITGSVDNHYESAGIPIDINFSFTGSALTIGVNEAVGGSVKIEVREDFTM